MPIFWALLNPSGEAHGPMQQLKKQLWACEIAQQVSLFAPTPNNRSSIPWTHNEKRTQFHIILWLCLTPITSSTKASTAITVITVFSNLLSRHKDLCSHIQPILLPALYSLSSGSKKTASGILISEVQPRPLPYSRLHVPAPYTHSTRCALGVVEAPPPSSCLPLSSLQCMVLTQLPIPI